MTIYIPYFYIIQDTRNGIYYAGSKYGRDANPEIFMKEGGYFTSSNLIKTLIEKYGINTFIIRKIKIFENKEDTYLYETNFLNRIDAKNNNRFYNRHNNKFYGFGTNEFKKLLLDTIGSENPSSLDWVKKKKEITCLVNHGVSSPLKNQEIKDKVNKTNNVRYGGNSPFNSKEIRDKYVNNHVDKYGVSWPTQRKEVKDKREETFIKKYGCNNPLNNPQIKQRVKDNRMKLHGVEHPSQMQSAKDIKSFKEKIKLSRSELEILSKYSKKFSVSLGTGWKQRRDTWIYEKMRSLYEEYGPLEGE